MNDWTPVGRPLAHPNSVIICPHWLLARQLSQNGPMIVAPYAPGHSSLLLKSPRVFNGDSVPLLTSSAQVHSYHCCSHPSILLFSVHHSSHLHSRFTTFTSSIHLFISSLRSISFRVSLSPLHALSCMCSSTCADWSLLD